MIIRRNPLSLNPFAELVERRRRAWGLTHEAMAERLGWHRSSIHAWRRRPDPPALDPAATNKLAEALEVSSVEILRACAYPV